MAKKLNTRKLTKDWLADQGYSYFSTEFTAPGMKFTKDLMGFVDCIGIKPGRAIVYIQYTSWTNVGSRLKKIIEECREDSAALVQARSVQLLVMGWRETDPDKDNLKIVEIGWDRKKSDFTTVVHKLRA